MRHTVIALKQVFSHRGKEIADSFFKVLEEFDLLQKIGWITTDNHSNNDTLSDELQLLLDIHNIRIDVRSHHVRCVPHYQSSGQWNIWRRSHCRGNERTEQNKAIERGNKIEKTKYFLKNFLGLKIIHFLIFFHFIAIQKNKQNYQIHCV